MRAPINRPATNEHAAYAITYVNATAAALQETGLGDVRDLLAQQMDALTALLSHVSEAEADRAYAPGKWTLKESLVHMCDTERVFTYRAMRVARADRTPLPGFEQDDYVPETRTAARSLADVLSEMRAVRAATLALVNSLDERAIAQVGTAGGNAVTPRALCWMVAGHAAHHISILRDRYLPALEPKQ